MTVCKFDPCERKAAALGYCQAHYAQFRAGKELAPIKKHVRYPQPAPDKKICTKCERVLHIDNFYNRTKGGKQSNCKACMKVTGRESLVRMRADARAMRDARVQEARESHDG